MNMNTYFNGTAELEAFISIYGFRADPKIAGLYFKILSFEQAEIKVQIYKPIAAVAYSFTFLYNADGTEIKANVSNFIFSTATSIKTIREYIEFVTSYNFYVFLCKVFSKQLIELSLAEINKDLKLDPFFEYMR